MRTSMLDSIGRPPPRESKIRRVLCRRPPGRQHPARDAAGVGLKPAVADAMEKRLRAANGSSR